MIAKIYKLQIAADKLAAGRDELAKLAGVVAGVPGCLEASAFQDVAAEDKLVFIEKWASQEAYDGSKDHLPGNAFSALGKTLAGAPDVTLLNDL